MSARIDYAAESGANLATVADVIQESGRVSIADTLAIAQVQATLALVDQQRLANMQYERFTLRSQAAGRTDSEARRLGEQADVLEHQIREGLGL